MGRMAGKYLQNYQLYYHIKWNINWYSYCSTNTKHHQLILIQLPSTQPQKDGHGPSLKFIIDEEQMRMDEALNIVSGKHARSASSIQQSADIGRQFAIFKSECK